MRDALPNWRTDERVVDQGIHFWADDITICPEFFIAIAIEPGQTQRWKRLYTFYEEVSR